MSLCVAAKNWWQNTTRKVFCFLFFGRGGRQEEGFVLFCFWSYRSCHYQITCISLPHVFRIENLKM